MLENKVKNPGELQRIVAGLKRKRKKIVFTNGCFDLLHLGHVKYLRETKRKGDILIVGINSDSSVRKLKGAKRPIMKERDRLLIVAALESVDYVVKFSQETPLKLIRLLKPDILVKGADWKKDAIVGKDTVKGYGGKVETIRFVRGRSTSGLINKIAKRF